MRKILAVLVVLITSMAFAQAPPPTNAPQFTVNLNFLTGTVYGQTQALSSAFTTQFTTNTALRADVIVMPSIGYTGTVYGAQYSLCGIPALETALSSTSLNCGKFSPYVNGGVGYGRVQSGSNPSVGSIAYLARAGANYDPTSSGKFTLNLFEGGYGRFGPAITGISNQGFYVQSGLSFGLGTSQASTQAKIARMNLAAAKKMKKMQAAQAKAAAKIAAAQK